MVRAGVWMIGMGWLAAGTVAAQERPAMQAYDRLSAAREQAEAARKDNDTPQTRRKAEDILRKALDDSLSPATRDLGEGSKALRYRAFNIRDDLFALYVDEGEKTKALDMMAANLAQDGAPLDAVYRTPKAQALLKDEPRYQSMLARADMAASMWHAKAIATPYTPQLDESLRIAGLSLFWSEAKYNFVHFGNVPNLDWDKAYLDFLPQVIAAHDTASYYEVMMRFAPLLQDGHTNIYPPKELRAHFYARPPLRTALVEGRVLVTFVGSSTLEHQGIHVGDQITAIDGIEVGKYATERVAPYESSSTPQDRDVRVYSYGLLSGDKDTPVSLSLVDGRGHRSTVLVWRDGSKYADRKEPDEFVFRMLPGQVAYLAIDDLESDAPVKAFEQHLPQIMQAKGLILDVRQNGGGSDGYAFQILSHLTEAPIPGPASRQLSVSAVTRAGGGLSLEWQPLEDSGQAYPHLTSPIFRGPVALLIGPQTFSAAEDFVMSFDTLKRGILVGQKTGGSTGMPMSFGLPGGGSARICVKWDSYADGREFVGSGIAPTIEVKPTVADVRRGKDAAVERARKALLVASAK
ncbi:S41 family peptidase [Dyella sp.]|uniref:S41 family peptidase n=1 Tax=Dyella sp. TaxID=1869338 RepID=UPI002ED1CE07